MNFYNSLFLLIMKDFQFEFDATTFNHIFPYFILWDKDFNILKYGQGLSDCISKSTQSNSIFDYFTSNPEIKKRIVKEKVTFSSKQTDLKIEGQIHSYKEFFLFLGTPILNNSDLGYDSQKNQEEQLVLLSLIAEKNINAVIICDSQGKIEWVNNSFITMSEFSFDEVIGKKPGEILQGKESNKEQIKHLSNQIKNGLPFKCEIINYKKSGEKYWVKIQGQALYSKEGKILKYFAIEEDITKNITLKSKTEELASNVAKTNKDLESYALIASHDLKGPIRSIYSLITFIKEDNELKDQSIEYLTTIENKLEKMNRQIEGILDYAQIDKDAFIYEVVNCNEIVSISIENLLIPKNIEVKIIQKLPSLLIDKNRLQQLFQKVICNAVKFIDKPNGIVEIDYKENRNSYIFSIKDNGRGVAKVNQPHLFNVSKYFNNNDRSTGLGLSIAKKIVELFNGKIWIESELGVGTTFFIELKK